MQRTLIVQGEPPYALQADVSLSQGGLCVHLCGGTLPHIGSAVLAQPRRSAAQDGVSCTSGVMNLCGHQDEAFARPMAEALCRLTGLPVCVCAGVHVDHATPEDIRRLTDAFHEISARIADWLRQVGAAQENKQIKEG